MLMAFLNTLDRGYQLKILKTQYTVIVDYHFFKKSYALKYNSLESAISDAEEKHRLSCGKEDNLRYKQEEEERIRKEKYTREIQGNKYWGNLAAECIIEHVAKNKSDRITEQALVDMLRGSNRRWCGIKKVDSLFSRIS